MGMALPVLHLFSLLFLLLSSTAQLQLSQATTWCVARSDASDQALQAALDYACGSGVADCTPIGTNGLCYLPNTMEAHASYAYNSYYRRRGMAPGSCDFSGTATIAKTDPSYGSCVYPSSLSTAGGMSSPTTTSSNPSVPTTTTTSTPTTFGGGSTTGLTNPPIPTTDNANALSGYMDFTGLIPLSLSSVFSFILLQMFIF